MKLTRYLDYMKHGSRMICKAGAMPCYVTFFVTSKCNMRCEHCFYWNELNSVKDELSVDEISRISKGMGDLLLLMLTGGEPTLRPDLADIAEIFCVNNNLKNLVIPTNGYDTRRVVAAVEGVLKRSGDTNVTVDISLDGLKEKHDSIRGAKGAFDNAVSTSRELVSLKAKYPNLNIGISMTMMRQNEDDLPAAYRFACDEIRPDCVSLSVARGGVKEAGTKEIDIGKFESLSGTIAKSMKSYGGFPFASFTGAISALIREELARTVREGKWIMPCYAGSTNAVIYPAGDVYFCELLDKRIGNLRDAGCNFKKVWRSPEADEARRYIKKERCFCIHDCNMYTNILFNPLYSMKILKKWAGRKNERYG